MKTHINIALTTAAILLFSNPIAAKPLSDNQLLGQCKTLAKAQFNDVKKVKLAKMKNTRGTFEATLRVTSSDDKGMFLCTIERNQEATIVRLDGSRASIAVSK